MNKSKKTNNNKNNSIDRKKDLPFEITESLIFQNNKITKKQNLDNKIKNVIPFHLFGYFINFNHAFRYIRPDICI